MTAGGTDYSCETGKNSKMIFLVTDFSSGILPGHQPDAIAKMQQFFPIFENGDFSKMVNYLRNPPFDDTFTIE